MAYRKAGEGESDFPGYPSKKWIGFGIVGIIIIIILFSAFYSIGPEEEGVIKRFGKYTETTGPGLHSKIPFVESVTKVKVRHIFKEEFGFRTLRAGIKTIYAPGDYSAESLMLTGDLNVVVVEWIVQYKVRDPVAFLFNVREQRDTIRAISEASMRQVVGDRSVDEIIGAGRIEAEQKAQKKLQDILNFYQTGIQIITVKLKDVNPPDPVKPSFNEVNEAKQERERTINQALQAYNKVIPQAKGEAEKTISVAEGYAVNRINRAEGEANKFLAVWQAYKKSPKVTIKRLYLETLNDVLPKIGKKYILDAEKKEVLPFLPLGEIGGQK